jgi:hypothetical protein
MFFKKLKKEIKDLSEQVESIQFEHGWDRLLEVMDLAGLNPSDITPSGYDRSLYVKTDKDGKFRKMGVDEFYSYLRGRRDAKPYPEVSK